MPLRPGERANRLRLFPIHRQPPADVRPSEPGDDAGATSGIDQTDPRALAMPGGSMEPPPETAPALQCGVARCDRSQACSKRSRFSSV